MARTRLFLLKIFMNDNNDGDGDDDDDDDVGMFLLIPCPVYGCCWQLVALCCWQLLSALDRWAGRAKNRPKTASLSCI